MSHRRVLRTGKKVAQIRSVSAFFHQQSYSILTPTQYVILAQVNPNTQKRYDIIRKTASQLGVAALAANQIRYNERFCTINKNLITNHWYSPKYDNYQDYRVYINPKITQLSEDDITTQIEQCASFPFFKFKVPRYNTIRIQYKDINRQQQEQQISGFFSRVFQQTYDKLFGRLLFNWRIHFGDMILAQQIQKYFPKTQQWIQEYNHKVKSTLIQFPELKKMQTLESMNKNSFSGQTYSFQQDYHYKIAKHFNKQFAIFNSRLQAGLIDLKGNQKTQKADVTDKNDKIEKAEKAVKNEENEKNEETEKNEKPEKPEKNEKTGKIEKPEKNQKTGKIEKPEKPEKNQKTGKIEKPEKPEKNKKTEKIEKPEKPEKNKKTEKIEKAQKGKHDKK